MSVTAGLTDSFITQLLIKGHDFTITTGDTFNIALFTSAATYTKADAVYSAVNEVANGNGYTTGGEALTNVTPVYSTTNGDAAICDFSNDVTWGSSTITADGALIYNTSNADATVMFLNFGGDKVSDNGDFIIQFPVADAATAILRITNP